MKTKLTMSRFSIVLITLSAMLAACTENQFKIDGRVIGAGDTTQLILEMSSNGHWFAVDTVRTKQDAFSIAAPAPEYPNIFRLRLGQRAICFPVDSLDRLTVTTSLDKFDTDYGIKGSEHAAQVMAIDKRAMQLAGNRGDVAELAAWKRQLAEQVVADPAGIVAYYVINKYVDNRPLFDPLDDNDLRIIGAVANAFYTFKPTDPRTSYLVSVLTDGQRRRRATAAPADTVVAQISSLIDIKLQDYTGKTYSLEQVAGNNRIVLLNFTVYQADFSPMFSKLLNDIYTHYRGRGLEIYQISLDTDNVFWSQAAKNLPWITVYEPEGLNSRTLGVYQVAGVPMTYIIRNGDIVERVEDAAQLEAAVMRHI